MLTLVDISLKRVKLWWLQNGDLQNQLDSSKREKEAAELKLMTQTTQMNSAIDNSKWELESALACKNNELEDVQRKAWHILIFYLSFT